MGAPTEHSTITALMMVSRLGPKRLQANCQARRASYHQKEQECNNEFAFLDVSLTRRPDGNIRWSVYRKKTYSGQYINFNSFVPIRLKRNLVSNLTFRARYICSEDTLTAELDNLKNIFMDNGYPNRFIEKT